MLRPDDLLAIDALKDLDPQQRTDVRHLLEEVVIVEGKPVFTEGGPGDAAYFILDGRVEVFRDAEEEDGEPYHLAEISRGWIVGEMALLDKGPRSATVIAKGRCRLAKLPREAFEHLLLESPAIASLILRRLARMLSLRLRRTNSLVT